MNLLHIALCEAPQVRGCILRLCIYVNYASMWFNNHSPKRCLCGIQWLNRYKIVVSKESIVAEALHRDLCSARRCGKAISSFHRVGIQ